MKKNEKKLEFRKTPNIDPHMIWFLSLNLVAQYMYIVIWMDSSCLGFFFEIGHLKRREHLLEIGQRQPLVLKLYSSGWI